MTVRAHDSPNPPRPELRTVSIVALLAGLTLTASSCSRSNAAESIAVPGGGRGLPATVTHVVDGDTVDLELAGGARERARLLGIDTPETVKPNAAVECFGPESSARTKQLLTPGTAVIAQRDSEARDRYGRLLVYLWRRSDGRFINGSLVTDGFARTLSIDPNTSHRADLSSRQADARLRNAGLWAACPPDE